MLDAIIVLFSICGLTYIIKESSILAKPRSWIMQKSSFMAALLYCYYCVGFWASIAVYFLHTAFPWSFSAIILWGCAGSAIGGLFNAVITYLTTFRDK